MNPKNNWRPILLLTICLLSGMLCHADTTRADMDAIIKPTAYESIQRAQELARTETQAKKLIWIGRVIQALDEGNIEKARILIEAAKSDCF